MSRPEHIVCINRHHLDFPGETWCGRKYGDFVFGGLDHAVNSAYDGSRLVACKTCTDTAIEYLTLGQDENTEGITHD